VNRTDADPAEPDLAWIEALSASAVGELLRPVDLAAGTTLARAGEVGEHFLLVVEGRAVVTDPNTGEEVAEVGPGSILGELALLTDGIRQSDVTVSAPLRGLVGDARVFDLALGVDEFRVHVATCAAARLAADAESVTVHDREGRAVQIRPLLPGDREAYLDALATASRETLVNRFFSGASPSSAVIDYLLDVDYVRHFAWVAIDPDGPGAEGQAIGLGRYIRDRDDPATAEWAVAVAETHRRRGVASLLLGALGVTAQANGVETLTANVLGDNIAMRALLDELGASWERVEAGVVATALPSVRLASLFDADAVEDLEATVVAMARAATLALA